MRRLALVTLLATLAAAASAPAVQGRGSPAPAGAGHRDAAAGGARWDTRVLALIPRPGFPALAYVHPNGRIYEGTYDNPAGDTVPSRVLEYTGDGALLRSWTVTGQTLSEAHGVQVATSDARGRLVLLDKSPARALLLDTRTGEQTTYATFADLPGGQPPMPDYAAWGPDGSLYVTDYQQAVIWRVPPGGGDAKVWLSDARLDGGTFGTAGIALAADRRTLVVAQASSAGGGEPNPTTGKLYAVPIQPDGGPGPMRMLWVSRPADAPDGFAIAASGRIYVALVGPAAQIAVVGPDGQELERFPQMPLTGDNGSPVPFDSPSSAMFLGTRLIVANQSYESGDPSHQAILDVETGEAGLAPLIPANAGGAPPAHAAPPKQHGHRRHHRHRHRSRPRHR